MTESPNEKSLRNVLLISGIDGWSVALFAGLCTTVALLFGEWVGVFIGGLVTMCGVWELRGRGRLARGEIEGIGGLVRAQVIILVTISLYAFQQLIAFDEATLMEGVTPDMVTVLDQAGITVEDVRSMLRPVYFAFYGAVMAATMVFQGGLALYYQSRQPKIGEAFAARRATPPA
jgi:hypothetical protein